MFLQENIKEKRKEGRQEKGKNVEDKINSQIIPGFDYLVLLHPTLEGTQHLQFQTVLIELHRWEK